MIDVYAFVLLLAVGAAWVPAATATRYLPRVEGDAVAIQQAYERGYRKRVVLRLLPPFFLLYFVGRAATASTRLHPPARLTPIAFTAIAVAFVLSSVVATLWRYRWDRTFVDRHPKFAGSVLPLVPRMMGPVVVLVSFSLLIGSTFMQDAVAVFGLIGLGIVTLFLGQHFLLRALVRSRVEVAPDSPFGRVTADIVARFGFTPKRTILAPSTVANAYALPDGTVMVTTALRTIATDEQIAAVLAHELSHARDRDVPRMRRIGLLYSIAAILLAVVCSVGAALLPGGEPFTVPLVACSMATFLGNLGFLRGRTLHRLEFKCDRAAVEIGLGPDLARCLTKLHDYMGIPHRWIGIERTTMTHPSLDDRLKLLGGS